MQEAYNREKSLALQQEPKYANFNTWLRANGAIFDKVRLVLKYKTPILLVC